MGDQSAKGNVIKFLSEFDTFQTQDDFSLRDSILTGFHQKLLEIYFKEHPDSQEIKPEDLEDFYQNEKNNHRGLDLITYSNMKVMACLSESDSLLSNLKDLITVSKNQLSFECMPLDIYRFYFLSLVFRLGGIIQRLFDSGLSSESLTLKAACAEQINIVTQNKHLSTVFLNDVERDLPDEAPELLYELNLSAISLKRRDDKNV
ncbi:hypothetical protein [Serratia symbiotica]|uniref:hypothetical protein n=1 Tax=Serratia symbiotica TaxID=138074 RepID=UPI00132BE1EA|nr:hypothetical protein [Serratia symbiotica]QTP13363.1 hypothetical protein GPZ83_0000040 [Serratia symbiotica]